MTRTPSKQELIEQLTNLRAVQETTQQHLADAKLRAEAKDRECNQLRSQLSDYQARNSKVRLAVEVLLRAKYQTGPRQEYQYSDEGENSLPIEVCEEARALRVIHDLTHSSDAIPF